METRKQLARPLVFWRHWAALTIPTPSTTLMISFLQDAVTTPSSILGEQLGKHTLKKLTRVMETKTYCTSQAICMKRFAAFDSC
jgi:hypothetical protein